MKKNKMMRIASVLLVAVLLSTCVISGTFAKYTSTFEADDTARVAKWVVSVKDKTPASETFVFDLFNTIYDTNGSAAEGDVDEDLVAPGTWGYMDFVITSASEVTSNYTVDFTETYTHTTNAPSPIKYVVVVYNPNAEVPAATLPASGWGEIADITVSELIDGDTTVRVYWQWEIGADGADNVHGEADEAKVTVAATITVTQVD